MQIEEERSKNERSFKEKMAKFELEQFQLKCSKELMESEKQAFSKNQLDDSFQYTPFQSNISEQIRRIMEHPSEESLHETQIKVREATQRCRRLGLNLEFIQTQIADEFGLFKAVVNIVDRGRNRIAEWPTARLNVWLDSIRDSDVTAANVFDSVDVDWTENENEVDLNESLNSSRISLNMSAMKGAMLGNTLKSSLSNLRDRFNPWNERKTSSPSKSDLDVKSKEFLSPKKKKLSFGNEGTANKENSRVSNQRKSQDLISTIPNDKPFEIEAQIELRNLRKSALKLKKLCNDRIDTANASKADDVLLAVTKIESLTNELRHILHVGGDEPVCKTPKSVRFVLD